MKKITAEMMKNKGLKVLGMKLLSKGLNGLGIGLMALFLSA